MFVAIGSASHGIGDLYLVLLGCTSFVFFHPILSVTFDEVHACKLIFSTLDNQPEVTKAIKTVLKDDYNYDSTVRKYV